MSDGEHVLAQLAGVLTALPVLLLSQIFRRSWSDLLLGAAGALVLGCIVTLSVVVVLA